MKQFLHITSGDIAGAGLARNGLPGEVFVWHDILYDGRREPGWPSDAGLEIRAGTAISRTHNSLQQTSNPPGAYSRNSHKISLIERSL